MKMGWSVLKIVIPCQNLFQIHVGSNIKNFTNAPLYDRLMVNSSLFFFNIGIRLVVPIESIYICPYNLIHNVHVYGVHVYDWSKTHT